jgi:hypothetical protein
MNTDNKYNGWTNYETWNANLWINNDWQLSELFAMRAGDLLGSYETDDATYHLAQSIKDVFLDLQPEVAPGFFSDVMDASLREVNWSEIAQHYITEWDDENEEAA